MAEQHDPATFQQRVYDWAQRCLGPVSAADTKERNYRYLEESLELVQSLGCSREDAHKLVDYVFSRPVGEPEQELGGVRVTLATLCQAHGLSEIECGERELERVEGLIETIRLKQSRKPIRSPLPGFLTDDEIEAAE